MSSKVEARGGYQGRAASEASKLPALAKGTAVKGCGMSSRRVPSECRVMRERVCSQQAGVPRYVMQPLVLCRQTGVFHAVVINCGMGQRRVRMHDSGLGYGRAPGLGDATSEKDAAG